jgi:23S rRNA (cytosine1962-C5)-methyltransferase
MTAPTYPALQLNLKEEKRLKAGHLWVYSNEVNTGATPLKSFSSGEIACVLDAHGKAMGMATMSPNALICARLLTRDVVAIDTDFFIKRLKIALSLRTGLFEYPHYRWVHGEGDFLPGLIIDRFGDDIVIQTNTAGMDALKDNIIEAVISLVKPPSITLRNDGRGRELEGLASEVVTVHGTAPAHLALSENGVTFHAPALDGQKTGWFYDHRLMRERLKHYVQGKRVLDVFAYLGSFGVQAAAFGAKEVVCVDVSTISAEWVANNAALNGVEDKVTSITGDAFEVMEALLAEGKKFDVVIVDPPAFIPKAKDMAKGQAAYQKLNALAIRLTQTGGFVFSGSCSMHLARNELLATVQKAARANDRMVQLIEETHQAQDHPVHPAIKETQYLKGMVFRVLMG